MNDVIRHLCPRSPVERLLLHHGETCPHCGQRVTRDLPEVPNDV